MGSEVPSRLGSGPLGGEWGQWQRGGPRRWGSPSMMKRRGHDVRRRLLRGPAGTEQVSLRPPDVPGWPDRRAGASAWPRGRKSAQGVRAAASARPAPDRCGSGAGRSRPGLSLASERGGPPRAHLGSWPAAHCQVSAGHQGLRSRLQGRDQPCPSLVLAASPVFRTGKWTEDPKHRSPQKAGQLGMTPGGLRQGCGHRAGPAPASPSGLCLPHLL